MNDYIDASDLGFDEKFAVGQPVPRSEDPVLLRGEGHYADDVSLPGQAYAVMVRSGHAHGVIRDIATAAARGMPGVLAVYTAAELAAGGVGPLEPRQVLKNRDGTPMLTPIRHALATDKVRYVGEAVAAVIAEGVAAAAHVTRLTLRSNRIVVNAMEPRSAIAHYDPARMHWTLHVGSQGVFGFRNYIADVLGVGRDKVRVLTDRVGGSFGMKQATYAEYYCILLAARELGRPVKWTDERSGSFVSDSHGRDHELTAELALDADGTFLAVRITNFGNMGGYLSHVAPMPSTLNIVK